jgi:hypothetical protein
MKYEMRIGGEIPVERDADSGLDMVLKGMDAWDGWNQHLIVQEKLDGWNAVIIKENGQCRYEAQWEKYSEIMEMLPIFEEFMPDDSVLCGELGFGTQASTEWVQKHGSHRFVIFDTPRWDGEALLNLGASERYSDIKKYWEGSQFAKQKDPQVDLVRAMLLSSDRKVESAKEIFRRVVGEGGEGIVLKKANGLYLPGIKNPNIWKVKKYVTKEYVIMGFHETDSEEMKSKGLIAGSINCGLFRNGVLEYVGRAGAIGNHLRKEFTDNPNQYIGQVVEVVGNEVFKSGAVRHPSFLRFRPDKKAEDCIF